MFIKIKNGKQNSTFNLINRKESSFSQKVCFQNIFPRTYVAENTYLIQVLVLAICSVQLYTIAFLFMERNHVSRKPTVR